MSWSDIKELFFALGSIAGVIALLRPVAESKFQRDQQRLERVKSLVDEQRLIELSPHIYQTRQISDERFYPFKVLAEDRRNNHDAVRFTGPLARHLSRELDALIAAYHGLREYIQVDEWEPRQHTREDGTAYTSWDFNKAAFAKQDGIPRDYASHLDQAAEKAEEMRRAFQRLQLVGELHFIEIPLASWLLKRRFKAHGL